MDAHVASSPLPARNKSTNDRSLLRIPPAIRFSYRLAARISPELAARFARLIFFRPPPAVYRAEQEAVLRQGEQAILSVRQHPIRSYAWGSGPAVVLVHGWGGHAGHMTEFVKPLVSAGYRVVAFDATAHGRSRGQLSSLVHFADAIKAAANMFGPAHGVIAHSLGAAATAYALRHGLSARRAVFLAPQAQLEGYWRTFREALGVSDDVWRCLQAMTEERLKIRFDDLHPAAAAPRMTTPLLILHGSADRMAPIAEGAELAALWPGAAFEQVEAGHLSILRDWRAVLASIDFMRASP